VSFDGQDAAVTPAMLHNQLVFLEGTVVGPGTLSFYWKVSSEPEWDRLRFEMNFNEITNISGEVDWQQVTVSVPEGSTTVSWTYQKDVDTSAGHDAAWLDQVMFTPAGPAPPVITEHPRSMAAAPGADVTFTVTATGVGLDYQWQKDGENLPGQTGMSLTLNNVTTGNAGAYRVIVTNNEGSVTSDPANLVVGLPTAITVHPVSQTVGVNGETVLSVVATGTGLSYQWLVNGGTLPGETGSTLTLPPGGASAGRYQVDVTGLVGGTIRSDVATVTVIDLRMYAGITIHGRVGDRYRIDFTLDLNANPVNWMEADTITLPGSPHYWFDLGSPGETMRYYRAVLLP